ncbi:segregation and condensation protein B [Sediminibacterium ginsengisoli]|uniref:Segregation and condensation protein B n=2 Tax=Sediminibacterium ginsengisoli TaxID=413434 RepID=A0A1T4KAS8_9BACT|nr:segregation and condensation protein B [Sediminibacterium ginsengisoli]
MELSQIIPHIEVLIFASDKPLTALDIVELINNAFGFMEQRITLDQVEASLEGVREKYNSEFYPFEVRESGGGWQFLTKKDYHKTIAQLNGDKFLKRLSNAALETLAIIAYKQPITKGEIEAIRGVNSDYSIQKLLEKELIIISGRNEALPGKPLVYATSRNFMDYFGINNAGDLPKIKEVLAEQIVEGTIISPEDFTDQPVQDALSSEEIPSEEPAAALTVNEEGELVDNSNPEEEAPEENPESGDTAGDDEEADEKETPQDPA